MPNIKYDDLGNPAMVQHATEWAIEDPIVVRVVDRIAERSEEGMKKYGVSMERDDISIVGWIDHTIEELLDASVYLERLRVGMVKIEEAASNNASIQLDIEKDPHLGA